MTFMFMVLLRWNSYHTWGLWKSSICMDRWLLYHVFWNQSQGPIIHGLKSLDRFYDAILPCPTVMLSGKDEFKIFQHYMYISSDRAAVGQESDPLAALVLATLIQKYDKKSFCFWSSSKGSKTRDWLKFLVCHMPHFMIVLIPYINV